MKTDVRVSLRSSNTTDGHQSTATGRDLKIGKIAFDQNRDHVPFNFFRSGVGVLKCDCLKSKTNINISH